MEVILMGRFNVDFAFRVHGYTGLTALEENVLTEMCRVSDDDTGQSRLNKNRENRIGTHAYCSINSIAMNLGKDRANVSRAVKSIERKGWIKREKAGATDFLEGVPYYVDTIFKVNIPKILRVYICKETFINELFNYKDSGNGIKNNTTKEEIKTRNAQAKALLDSATITFPDDFKTLWITSTTRLPTVQPIYDWRDLVERSSKEELMNYWLQYRQRNFGIAGNNTEIKANTKEQQNDLSTSNDNTIVDHVANRYSDNDPHWNEFKQVFPVQYLFKSRNDEDNTDYSAVQFGVKQINEYSVLDVELADFQTEQQKEDFLSSDRVIDLMEFNKEWGYYIHKIKEDIQDCR